MVLESFGHLARMSSLIYFEAVLDSVGIERTVQLASIDLETVLIADIDRDFTVSPKGYRFQASAAVRYSTGS